MKLPMAPPSSSPSAIVARHPPPATARPWYQTMRAMTPMLRMAKSRAWSRKSPNSAPEFATRQMPSQPPRSSIDSPS